MARKSKELGGVEARFHELLDELKRLTVAFPHLQDAFGDEDLPIAFLLKRGAARARAKTARVARRVGPKPAAPRRKSKK